jgi:flagellar motor switch protein FliN/FliY
MSADVTVNPRTDHREENLQRLLHISTPVAVVLAQQEMSLKSILEMTIGTILEFSVPADANLALYVGNRPIATGRAMKINERFGLRITQIETVEDRIDALSSSSKG